MRRAAAIVTLSAPAGRAGLDVHALLVELLADRDRTNERVAALEAQNEEVVTRLEASELTVERLSVLTRILGGRVVELEGRAGVASPVEDDGCETTVKDAAFLMGCSQSQIRKLGDDGKIKWRKIGSRRLVEIASLPLQRSAK